jgi:uncharacterized LabA/DUF88 family protein
VGSAISGGAIPPNVTAYAYVDGGYVRAVLKQNNHPFDFNPRRPSNETVLSAGALGAADIVLTRVFYYDAIPEDEEERAQHEAYLQRIESLPDTFVGSPGYLRHRKRRWREQKAVDVQLTVDAIEVAYSGHVQVITLIAGDLDFVPLVESIRRAGPHVIVGAYEDSLARELRAAADRVVLFDHRLSFGEWPN